MRPTIRPTLKQHLAWEALRTHDEVFFGGAAGGGKSWWLCETRLVNAYFYPGYKSFIAREELKRLMISTYITWCKVCKFHEIPPGDWYMNGKYNYIQFFNGSRIDLLDVKYLPGDPLYERFGSQEYTDGAIEETGEVHFLAYDVLKTRIGRHLNKEYAIRPTMVLTGNPKKNWTYSSFYLPSKNGTLPANIAFIRSFYHDNPYTKDIYQKQLEGIRDKATKARLMHGEWEYEDDPTCLLDVDDINNLFTNTYVAGGTKYIIADIARFGSNRAIITVWDGLRLIEYHAFDISATTLLQNVIQAMRAKHKVQLSNILCDEDGVGGGVVDNLRCKGFINNGKPLDGAYQNIKTECAYKLAATIKDVYIACEMPELEVDSIKEELGMLKTYEADKDNKLRVLPKEKIKEVIGRSPDWLDCFIMRMRYQIEPQSKPQIWHT